MPLDIRENAVVVAVLCFFTVAFIAAASGLDPYVCCKKAMLAAFGGYIAAGILIRIINAIVTDAIVTRKIEQHKNRYPPDTK